MSRYTAMWWRVLSCSLVLTLAVGCNMRDDESDVVARVYDRRLRVSDLQGLTGEGLSAEDSSLVVASYIDQWVRQTVMLVKAEKNVTDDFERQLKEYRNSLLIYTYEQQIVSQLLDTVVTQAQIEEYYENHREEFLLKTSIVKAVYVVAPRKSAADSKLRAMVGKSTFKDNDIYELEELATRNGLRGYYDGDNWMSFYTLQSAVPIVTYNESMYLKQNRSAVLQDDSLSYYVRIMDYKVSDDVSPMELQEANIKAIILNHRKREIISRLQADLLKEAEDEIEVAHRAER